ncbi:hypothetical protein BJ684DRAFT_21054 [Piptocephalis cylindrospora]|uniref:DUF7707 domain-containing protein n=1 Tax=Piptocephalis cylindrospora TaxID=1907219 RepID=A0A4P9Y158_9FUNG|nr:hypothetical protein BJ684DRAFT_21054 [Piptocephalis cylindrospora]|eukprot:RKP12404.1 hypothetical protein BJ684DRAFT_21054 [Piptocephalis cylindrospora]
MQTSTLLLTTAALLLSGAIDAQNVTSDWQITSRDNATRQGVCSDQIQRCMIDCGGSANSPKNFCNPTTMGWGCGCGNATPKTPKYLWPVTLSECNGKLEDCINNVCPKTKTGADVITCQTSCRSTYGCNEGKAPATHLEVNDVNEVPDYNGTKGDANKGNGNGSNTSPADNLASTFSWPAVASGLSAVAAGMLLL